MSMSDAQIAKILDHTASVADPILDILANSDPLNLKPRTFGRRWYDLIPTSLGDASATALNVADWPGTAGWEALSPNDRADWWVDRIGALSTLGAAFPGMFGAWTKKLPVGTFLGAASQALIVLAVGREYGVLTRTEEIALLGAVLFGREVDGSDVEHVPAEELPRSGSQVAKAVAKGMWDIALGLRRLEKALGARPQSPKLLKHLGWVPLLGGPATYLGERIALRRAADGARMWVADHPEATGL